MVQDKLKQITIGVYEFIERGINRSKWDLRKNREVIQDAIEAIRESYEHNSPPDFSTSIARFAYFVHYHPAHMIAAWQFFDQSDQELKQALPQGEFSGLDIGCGAGAISLALDAHRKKTNTWQYTDQQKDWPQLIADQRNSPTPPRVISYNFKNGTPEKHKTELEQLIKDQQVIVVMGLVTELGYRNDYYLKHLLRSCSPGAVFVLGDVVGEGNHPSTQLFSKTLANFELLKESSIKRTLIKKWIPNKELAEIYRSEDKTYQKKKLSFHFQILKRLPTVTL